MSDYDYLRGRVEYVIREMEMDIRDTTLGDGWKIAAQCYKTLLNNAILSSEFYGDEEEEDE